MQYTIKKMLIAGILLICLCVLPGAAWGATGETVKYVSGDETIQGYLARPEGQGPFPAVIVIHEWWGLNDWIRLSADKLADQGYMVLAIDLYRGQMTANAGKAHELMRSVPGDRATRDLEAAVAYLKYRSDVKNNRIGAMGWSMGGGYALTMALSINDLAACVINYGSIITEKSSIKKIPCPVLGIFGENDRGIPSRGVRAFEQACRSAGKNAEIHLYPGAGHAFMDENDKRGYNAEATADAWRRIGTFLEKTLK